jgi:hypothetical protein
MELASVSLGSLVFIALSPLALRLVLATASVHLKGHRWLVSVMRVIKDMTVQRRAAQMTALVMASVLMVFALVRMDGVVMIVRDDALVSDSVVPEMESALMGLARATLAGRDMLVISVLACMIAVSMVSVIMELVSARRVTGDETALFPPNLSLANVLFIVSVVACNNALRCMKRKVLDHHMSVILSALRSVFLSVLPERCL